MKICRNKELAFRALRKRANHHAKPLLPFISDVAPIVMKAKRVASRITKFQVFSKDSMLTIGGWTKDGAYQGIYMQVGRERKAHYFKYVGIKGRRLAPVA